MFFWIYVFEALFKTYLIILIRTRVSLFILMAKKKKLIKTDKYDFFDENSKKTHIKKDNVNDLIAFYLTILFFTFIFFTVLYNVGYFYFNSLYLLFTFDNFDKMIMHTVNHNTNKEVIIGKDLLTIKPSLYKITFILNFLS